VTRVRGSRARVNRRTVISSKEFQAMLNRAKQIKDKFFRLRAQALLCLLRLTGKRRAEVAMLRLNDFRVEAGFLHVTFTLLKKRKGSVLQRQAIKIIPLTDPLAKPILEYLSYLNGLEPKPTFFLPRVKSVFGYNVIVEDAHIGGRQVFNIVRELSDQVWPHLFRETVGSDVIKADPSIIGAFRVMRRLDLEDYRTGFNYLRRFAGDVIRREEEKLREETAETLYISR
jgi:integrase